MLSPVVHVLKTPIRIRLSYFWNLGSILGVTLIFQLITGILLVFYYVCDSSLSLIRVEYIIREVNRGWLIRVLHLNGASLLLFCLYLHIARGLILGSFRIWKVWISGIILLVLGIAEALLGYVLPWGQMSVWGACVITRLLRVIPLVGEPVVIWIWGGLIVNRATLGCFFALHYFLPFVMLIIVGIHILFLHEVGSTSPRGRRDRETKIGFWPYLVVKDIINFIGIVRFFFFCIIFPFILSDCENFSEANLMKSPVHIQPEWYFLFLYAVLRAVPNKVGGVLTLCLCLIVVFCAGGVGEGRQRNVIKVCKGLTRGLVCVVIILTWLGSIPVEFPFGEITQRFTFMYFMIASRFAGIISILWWVINREFEVLFTGLLMALMYYFFIAPIFLVVYTCCLVILGFWTDRWWLVEEGEHFILSIVGVFILFLVLPVLERGIKFLFFLSIITVVGFLCVRTPTMVYVLLELSVVPVVIIIIGWGNQPERVRATFHLFVYTLIFSLPLFLIIVLFSLVEVVSWVIILFLGAALIVKTPLFMVHVWLPKAHVEAPTAGSIILAGILLKIGGIGLIWRINYCFSELSLVLLILGVLGARAAAIGCRFQRDIKALVAYSRVAHINYSAVVVILIRVAGDCSRRILMLVHSFVRRRILFLAGRCLYAVGSRILSLVRGILVFKDGVILLVLGIMISNLSIPPSIGFLGELGTLVIFFNSVWFVRLTILFYFFFVAYYSLFLMLCFVGEGGLKLRFVENVPLLICVIRTIDCIFVGLY